MRKTKIICTLGPACSNEETIRQLLKAGMNIARINFSHGDHEYHSKNIDMFRKIRDELELPAAVMLDTKGPEIRLKDFENGSVKINEGDIFTLTSNDILGNEKIVSITYKDLPSQITIGTTLLIDDGRISLEAIDVTNTDIKCKVIQGGTISNHKGLNVPRIHLEMPYLSEQDKKDILLGIEKDVDFVAASFVRRKEDVQSLRKFIDYNGGHSIKIISKIENIEGIENFDEILDNSDGIMLARGDLGVEVAYEKLPGIQKKFIKSCYIQGKMVITATQMLDSMINNPNPTRAEITDVANAVFDGTSAVMLSGESAVGKFPVRSVKVMAKIAEQAEKDAFDMGIYTHIRYDMDETDTTNAMCDAACTTARDINAKCIIAVTISGNTARGMSKFRPYEPIVAATPSNKTFHQLSLSWGVYPVLARLQKKSDELFIHSIDCAKQIDLVEKGDRVVITGGIPLDLSGNTNTIRVAIV